MKVLRLVGMAFMAILMCVNFVACSNNEVPIPEEPQKDKLITVGLKCTGEFLDITNSPFSRAEGGDEYHIQVFSLEEKTEVYDDGSYTYMVETPYAHGIFESLDDATIKLLDGHKYKFQIAIAVGQGRDMEGFYNTTDFTYSSTVELNPDGAIYASHEGFYGELDQYVPVEGGSVNIETKRVSYGIELIAEGLEEGTLDITVAESTFSDYYVTLTPNVSQYTGIHSFEDVIGAWLGKEVQTGVDEDGDPIYGRENYTNEVEITINWTKSDDNVTPLGTHKVVFERNVKTTIRIKVEEVSVSNGVTITRENTLLTDDDNEYVIEGGSVVEIPVGGTDN